MIFLLLCVLILLYGVYKVAEIALKHHQYSHIPGPKRDSFIYGNAKTLGAGLRETGNFGEVLRRMVMEYGDILVYWRVTKPVVLVSDLSSVKEYTTNIKVFQKIDTSVLCKMGSARYAGFHSILTDVGGPIWEHKKRIMDPAFKISRLQSHIPKLYAIGETVAEKLLETQNREGEVDFKKTIAPYTINAISSAGFSVVDKGLLKELSDGQTTVVNHFVKQFQTSPLQKTWIAEKLGYGASTLANAEAQVKYIRKLGKRLIMERATDGSYGSVNDALDFIMAANQKDGNLEIEDTLDDFMAMYEAGNITTSTTLGFTIAELVRNPHCMDKLQKEVEEVWVEREISRLSPNEDVVAALKDMPYLDAVINETLRFHAPVIGSNRVCTQPLEIQGYKIPAHSTISLSQHVLHYHPKYWSKPEIFNPDRFVEGKPVPFSFFPFLVGPRKCLGKNFALLEMKIFLAIWLSRLNIEKAPDCPTEIQTVQSLLVNMVDNRILVTEK